MPRYVSLYEMCHLHNRTSVAKTLDLETVIKLQTSFSLICKLGSSFTAVTTVTWVGLSDVMLLIKCF